MSHAVRPVETGTQDRDENVRHYLRETDSARSPQLRSNRKSIRLPRLAADETFASDSSPRFLREQYRHISLSAPKRGSVFRLRRSIPRRWDSDEVVGDPSRRVFAPQPCDGWRFRRFRVSCAASIIKNMRGARSGSNQRGSAKLRVVSN